MSPEMTRNYQTSDELTVMVTVVVVMMIVVAGDGGDCDLHT